MNKAAIAAGIVVVILVAIGIYYMMNKTPEEPVTGPAPVPVPAPAPEPAP